MFGFFLPAMYTIHMPRSTHLLVYTYINIKFFFFYLLLTLVKFCARLHMLDLQRITETNKNTNFRKFLITKHKKKSRHIHIILFMSITMILVQYSYTYIFPKTQIDEFFSEFTGLSKKCTYKSVFLTILKKYAIEN